METFNEVTTIIVLYMFMLFSDFIGDPLVRSFIGQTYIVVIIAFAACHLIPVFYVTLKQIFRRIKRVLIIRKAKKAKNKPVDELAATTNQASAAKTWLSEIDGEKSDQLVSLEAAEVGREENPDGLLKRRKIVNFAQIYELQRPTATGTKPKQKTHKKLHVGDRSRVIELQPGSNLSIQRAPRVFNSSEQILQDTRNHSLDIIDDSDIPEHTLKPPQNKEQIFPTLPYAIGESSLQNSSSQWGRKD